MLQTEQIQGITRRKFLKYSRTAAIAATATLGELMFAVRSQSATPPNILLIVADDLGQTLRCYDDAIARTPNLNRLASQGIRFTNSYVTNASCSSSRSSIYTGLYPHQTGFFPPIYTPVGQIGLAEPNGGYSMDPRVMTIPQLLKMAGYYTGIIGKLHIYPEASFPFDYNTPEERLDTRNIEAVVKRAVDFWQNLQQPFFLAVNFSDPHAPYYNQYKGYPQQPLTAADVQPFPWHCIDTPKERQRITGYYNGVSRLDTGVGMLLKQLAQLGLASNTMVIFISDHGPGFIRAKGTCYEAGLRIPFIVRWPGKVLPNQVNNSLVSTVDILPTVLQAAGMKIPENLAGRSLMPLFRGNTTTWRSLLYAEYTSHNRECFYPRRCVRGSRYKYILNLLPNRKNPYLGVDGDQAYAKARLLPVGDPVRGAFTTWYHPPQEELYDLEKDPCEFNNLAGKPKYAESLNFLQGKLRNWRKHSADPLLDKAVLAAMVRQHYLNTNKA